MSVFLHGSPTLIRARIAGRVHAFMPASLLASQFAALDPSTDGVRVEIARGFSNVEGDHAWLTPIQ